MSWDNAGGGGGGGWDGGAAASSLNQPAGNDFGYSGTNEYSETAKGYGDEGGAPTGIGGGAGDNDGACFNCREQGHTKADCPQPPKSRGCFNCGEEGHSKAECTNPAVAREFTGNCRICEQQGHRASDCPTAPPKLCSNCKKEGHSAVECKNPRKVDRSAVEDIPAEQAWAQLVAASADGDFDDIKDAALKYIKATPDMTYLELETAFRNQNITVYLICLEKELAATYTNMDLQGNLDKKYSISWRKSAKPLRPKEKEGWPTPEENIARLEDAGEPVDRGIPKCSNCEQLGHISKSCKEDKNENADRAVVKCFNCDELGHRVRDCPNPRPDKFACRNCKQSGHSSKECPEPRSAEGVECKKCGEVGHFSRDCPTGGGGGGGGCHNCGQEGHRAKDCTEPKKLVCRNCDAEGHLSKDCPKPRDYSRVQCQNCKQMGHTKVRCKEPLVEDDIAGNADGYTGGGADDAGAGGYDESGGHGGDSGAAGDFGTSGPVAVGAGEESWDSGAQATTAGW